ncbi:unnamed protein product [Ambrosiozyma monospora]|uniref:Unnamed protein product n=1 Tax=Ambrosiozyma monospora TaxID=43982 RepID=A0A9W6Z0K1_AMBMO|nr:unnamed protein product [Ambrosiozyma monospora]
MGIQSFKQRLSSKKKRIIITKNEEPQKKEKHSERYPVINLSTNIFEDFPQFRGINVANFDSTLTTNSIDGSSSSLDGNANIVLECVYFLLNVKFQNLSRYKMTKSSRAKLIAARSRYPNVIIVNQLYTIFPNSETCVDTEIEKLTHLRKLKLITLNYDNFPFRLLILQDDLTKLIDTHLEANSNVVSSFKNFIHIYPNVNQISKEMIEKHGLDVKTLIQTGFLTFSESSYNLTLPNIGPTLKMLKIGIRAIIKVCQGNKFGQIEEAIIMKKFTDVTKEGVATKNGLFVKTNGLDPHWLLSVMVGSGLLECFYSSVGRVYKLTGKNLQ